MIWDLKTITAITGYRAVGDIDIGIIARYGDQVMQDFGDRLFKELTRYIGTSWPVKIERDDCVIEKIGETYMSARYEARWQPTDRPGEVMDPGGRHDGMIVPAPDAIGNGFGILRLLNDDPSIESMFVADPDTGEHPIITAENRVTAYEVTGWSDLHRQWIYTRMKGPQR